MGTINYKKSDYITIGYNCNNIDYDNYEWYNDEIQYQFDELANRRAAYNFYYFHVSIEPGYYEGFLIDIEFNFTYCLDNYEEKREALKEIRQIKKFLYECVSDFECCAVSPGWCTAYYNHDETLRRIDEAIKEMKNTVKKHANVAHPVRHGKNTIILK